MSSTISSPRDDAWMGLALEELLDGLQMGHRPQPSLLAPLRVAGGRRQIPSAEQLYVPPDHRFGPIRVDTTPPRPRPTEAAHTPADQGKQQLTDQGPLVPLRTTRPPSTQATQGQGDKQSPREAPQAAGPSTRPHTGQVSTTPTGNQGQPPRAAPRAAAPSTRPHTGRATTTSTGHVTPSPRATPRVAMTPARSRTGPTLTTLGTRAVQAIAPLVPSGAVAAPDPDGEEEAALRECLGDLPPDVLEEMAHGAEGLDMEDLFGESPDEDGVELPIRPVSDQSADEPRTPSPQFQPDYEVISSDEGEADEIIQISDSDDAEPNFRPPGTPPPAYEDIFGPGPYATSCPITTCAASSPSQSPPTTSRGYHAAVAPRQADGPSTSQHVDLTTDEDSADERPAVAVPSCPPLARPGEYAAAVARRRAEDLSDELGSSSAGPVRPINPEPRSARDRPPTPAPARRGRRRSAPWADSPSESSSEEELPRDRQGHTRWLPVPDGWSMNNGTLPAGLIRRIQQRLLIARRRARRYLEEEQGQRSQVQLNRDDHVRVFLHPTRK
ncbi:NHS-like protein 3 [Drosophila kikkawai]|uniref:NHS-like protein 3 n=1 Tax=Drosophila kikkawai TaxID=30033 RepID=A0ABM4GG28_DROKI